MKKILILLILSNILLSCQNRQKTSFSMSIFRNIDSLKCLDGNYIESYLLRSGYFESTGKHNGVNNFIMFTGYKDMIAINTFDSYKGFLLISNKPDIYNYVVKNGNFKRTGNDSRGYTNLIYAIDNQEYWLRKQEHPKLGMSYYLFTICL